MTSSPLEPVDLPYAPIYVADWLKMTSHLPLEVQGGLLRLVLHQWAYLSVPGDDPKAVARILGLGTAQATRLWKAVEHLFTLRTVDGGLQVPCWEKWRGEAERKARTNKTRSSNAARSRWDRMQRPPSNAPSIPLSDAPSNAPSIPPSSAQSNASHSQSQGSSSSNSQIGGLETPQHAEQPRPSAMPTNGRKTAPTLIARGEGVAWFNQMEAKHRGCHPEICHWRDEKNVRICMPSAQVHELASKLPSMGLVDAQLFVIDWARKDVPPEGYVAPSSEFEHWRTRWDDTIAKRPTAAQERSAVPSAEDTRRRYLS